MLLVYFAIDKNWCFRLWRRLFLLLSTSLAVYNSLFRTKVPGLFISTMWENMLDRENLDIIFKKDLFVFISIYVGGGLACMYVNVCYICAVVPRGYLRAEEGVGSHTARVIGGYEQSDMGTGKQTHILFNIPSAPSHWATSPASSTCVE